MRNLLAAFLVLLLLCPLHADAYSSPAPQPKTFAAFWLKFKTALAQNDKQAVASMTKLPFAFDRRELDRATFIRRFNIIFDREVKRCFAREKPVKDTDSYALFCGETIYLFAKVGDEYKFTEIGVND